MCGLVASKSMRLERSAVLMLAASTIFLLIATLAVKSRDSTKRFWHFILLYSTFEACVVGVYLPSIGTLVLVLLRSSYTRFSWILYYDILWCSVEHLGRHCIFGSAPIRKHVSFGRCHGRVALGWRRFVWLGWTSPSDGSSPSVWRAKDSRRKPNYGRVQRNSLCAFRTTKD